MYSYRNCERANPLRIDDINNTILMLLIMFLYPLSFSPVIYMLAIVSCIFISCLLNFIKICLIVKYFFRMLMIWHFRNLKISKRIQYNWIFTYFFNFNFILFWYKILNIKIFKNQKLFLYSKLYTKFIILGFKYFIK